MKTKLSIFGSTCSLNPWRGLFSQTVFSRSLGKSESGDLERWWCQCPWLHRRKQYLCRESWRKGSRHQEVLWQGARESPKCPHQKVGRLLNDLDAAASLARCPVKLFLGWGQRTTGSKRGRESVSSQSNKTKFPSTTKLSWGETFESRIHLEHDSNNKIKEKGRVR